MTQFFAKKLNKKGFTLAELLIVVAIIAVLVAIAIPIFVNSLERARFAVHQSNGRALKGMAVAEVMADINNRTLQDGSYWEVEGTYDFDTEEFGISSITFHSSGFSSASMTIKETSGSAVNFDASGEFVKAIGQMSTSGTKTYNIVFGQADLSTTITGS